MLGTNCTPKAHSLFAKTQAIKLVSGCGSDSDVHNMLHEHQQSISTRSRPQSDSAAMTTLTAVAHNVN